MRKIIIAGNWKMYKTLKDGEELVNSLKRSLYQIENVDIVVCPPFTLLAALGDALTDSNIALGAQDCYWQEEGAFTGEVSCNMIRDTGCAYVIIGHSERRQFFGETNETVNKKVNAALKAGLLPIVCVGETLAEREKGLTFKVLDSQVNNSLKDINADDILKVIIAYEPVWAIGTGKTATAQQAQEAHKYIRGLLEKSYGKEISGQIRIQYGGSVKPENSAELLKEPDIDGALVGGASLKADSFSDIVKKAGEINK